MRISLKVKTIIVILAAFIFLSIATLLCYYQGIDNLARDQFGEQSAVMARTIALSVDADMTRTVRDAVMDIYKSIPEDQRKSIEEADDADYSEYIDNYSDIRNMVEYHILETSIVKIMEQSQIFDLRLCCTDSKTNAVIYLVDATTDHKFKAETGSFFYASEEDQNVMKAPGLGFEPRMSNTDEFGWLMTTAAPLYDMNFHVIGFAEISIDMNSVVHMMHTSTRNMAILILMIILVIGGIIIIMVERAVVRPINMLSDASIRYYSKDSKQSSERIKFSDLDIHTGDEIETLAQSMAFMEKDIEDYISSLTETKDQLNTTREYAYYDALTGVRNKRAYNDTLEGLRIGMINGDTDYGIAVIDLNDLKYYNDTFGHEKGDIAIRTICSMICNTFKHSPVFRYGGDEFAVILKGSDLAGADDLIAMLRENMEMICSDDERPPWLRVRAAIGYAVCDPTLDSDPETVFKRADNEMYENKKKMKAKQ